MQRGYNSLTLTITMISPDLRKKFTDFFPDYEKCLSLFDFSLTVATLKMLQCTQSITVHVYIQFLEQLTEFASRKIFHPPINF